MKPDWSKAPKWAKWLAMDKFGDWYWFEDHPQWDKKTEDWKVPSTKITLARPFSANQSLHPRPTQGVTHETV